MQPDATTAERIIYNSLDPNNTEDELEAIARYGIRSAVLLAFGKQALLPQARMKLLTEPGGLLDKARMAGIQCCLIDPGVLDVPSLAWTVITIGYVKEQLGLPCGCAPSNSVYLWKKMRAKGSPVFEGVADSVFSYPVINGADFLLYGPTWQCPVGLPGSGDCRCNHGVWKKGIGGPHPGQDTSPIQGL